MTSRTTKLFIAGPLLFLGLLNSVCNAQQTSAPAKAVQLTGLAGVKDNAKGVLSVEGGILHFACSKGNSDVSASSIEDVVTGSDTQASVGKTLSTLSMAAPYGGGRFLALFRSKIDTLTVQYRDASGGLHGAIFTLPVGTAEAIKNELVAQGARTATAQETSGANTLSSATTGKEQK